MPAPQPPPRSRLVLLALALVVLLGVVAVVLVAQGPARIDRVASRPAPSGSVAALPRRLLPPLDVARLPPQIESVERIGFRATLQSRTKFAGSLMSEEALWSLFSQQVCLGPDLFGNLLRVPPAGSKDRGHDGAYREHGAELLGPRVDETRIALDCGRQLTERLSLENQSLIVRFMNGKERMTVVINRGVLARLPWAKPPFESRAFGSHRGGCQPARRNSEAGAGCSDRSNAIVMLDGLWLRGQTSHLQRFLSHYDEATSQPTVSHQDLEVLAGALTPDDALFLNSRSGGEQPAQYVLRALERCASASAYLRRMLPLDRHRDLARILVSRASAHGWACSSVAASGMKIQFGLVAATEGQAADFQRGLASFRQQWSAHLDGEQKSQAEEFSGRLADLPSKELDYQRAVLASLVRAVRTGHVEVRGRTAVLALALTFQAEERRRVAKRLTGGKERVKVAARVTRALVEGQSPRREDLSALGGQRFLDAIARGGELTASGSE